MPSTVKLLQFLYLLYSPVLALLPVPRNDVTGSQLPLGITRPLSSVRVPIVLGVMSRCPDALLCESVLDSVFQDTWDIVNVSLSFIGRINASETNFGVTCMHGVEECRGNIQELCAVDRADSQQDWWNFLQCLNFEGRDKIGDAALAEKCAGVASIPWNDETSNGTSREGIRNCIDGKEGKDLLKQSVTHTSDIGITKSCTIMISGKPRCIHDGTWKECETGHTVEEFISFIRQEHDRLNSNATLASTNGSGCSSAGRC